MNPIGKPQIKITPDMMKGFKTLTCDCGGMLFEPGVVIKKISPLVSPTGNEENYPFQVLICKKCGLVPSEMNKNEFQGMLPDEVVAKKIIKMETIIK